MVPKLQEKNSALKREHPVLKNMKILDFFSIFVGHFCPPGSGSAIWCDPDPATHINADPCGSGYETLVRSPSGKGRQDSEVEIPRASELKSTFVTLLNYNWSFIVFRGKNKYKAVKTVNYSLLTMTVKQRLNMVPFHLGTFFIDPSPGFSCLLRIVGSCREYII